MMPTFDFDQWDDEHLFHPLLPVEADLFRENVIPVELLVLPNFLQNDLASDSERRNQSMRIVDRSRCSGNVSLRPFSFFNLGY